MKAAIEQRLGEVHRRNVVLLGLSPQRYDELVAGPALRKRELEARPLELRHEVVGIQSRVIRHPLHALASKQAHIDIGPQQDTRITHERGQPADAPGAIGSVYPVKTLPTTAHDRCREERLESVAHAHGARTGTASAVRRGERLVQIDVNDVEPHSARQRFAQNRVEVGTIVVEKPTGPVDDLRDVPYPPLENAEGGRVGQHDPRRFRPHGVPQGVDVHVSIPACR